MLISMEEMLCSRCTSHDRMCGGYSKIKEVDLLLSSPRLARVVKFYFLVGSLAASVRWRGCNEDVWKSQDQCQLANFPT